LQDNLFLKIVSHLSNLNYNQIGTELMTCVSNRYILDIYWVYLFLLETNIDRI